MQVPSKRMWILIYRTINIKFSEGTNMLISVLDYEKVLFSGGKATYFINNILQLVLHLKVSGETSQLTESRGDQLLYLKRTQAT